MRRVLVRERFPYSIDRLCELLSKTRDETVVVMQRAVNRGIAKHYDPSTDEDYWSYAESGPSSENKYQFCFVGLVLMSDLLLVVYPKYFRDRTASTEEMKQVLKCIRKDSGFMTLPSLSDEGLFAYDELALMLALLDSFEEYGIYSNFIDTRENNGNGQIDWMRTINERIPFFSNNTPVYVDYISRKSERDESDFITRLHRAVLTECSNALSESGVSDLLSLDELWLSDEKVEDLGDAGSLLWRLGRERNVQFVTWKQDLLALLEAYVSRSDSSVEMTTLGCVGTTSFYNTWENACKVAFGDKLNAHIGSLGIHLAPSWTKRKGETLLSIIPRPQWTRVSEGANVSCGKVDTLIPDIITLTKKEGAPDIFGIFDAKYYVPVVGKQINGQPGVESVNKQFLYQSAYRDFIIDHEFSAVTNAFLVPTCETSIRKLATVSFPGVFTDMEPPLSNEIGMWELPATTVYDAFLEQKQICDIEFKVIWE